MDQQLDVEAPQPVRHPPPDVPVADEADGRAGELPRRVAPRSVPAPAADVPVELGDAAQEREHQSDGVVGDRVLVGPGRRRHLDAVLGGRVQVDRVHADTDSGDDPQVARGPQHVGGERVGGDDGTHGAGEQVRELVGGPRAELRGQAELEPGRRASAPPSAGSVTS